jgi:ribulose-phosphate 3-epimerase
MLMASKIATTRKRRVLIAPSVLASDFGDLRNVAKRLNGWKVDRIHIDVMDGHFVPNITVGPQTILSIRGDTDIPFETHLMIEKPYRYIKEFVEAGSDIVIVHCEAERNVMKSLNLIKRYRARAGVAINPDTPFEEVKHYLPKVDTFLIMGVHPGFGGQRFIRKTLAKIGQARDRRDQLGCNTRIAVDGGMDIKTGRMAVAAGADELVVGTALFKSKSVLGTLNKLRKLK